MLRNGTILSELGIPSTSVGAHEGLHSIAEQSAEF
jgi:hypothetical protein